MFDPKENIEDEIVNDVETVTPITLSEYENGLLVIDYQEDEWDNICGDLINFK